MNTITLIAILVSQCTAVPADVAACAAVEAYVDQMHIEDMSPEDAGSAADELILVRAMDIWRQR